MSRSKYFGFVNIAKLILAIAVVAMHCAIVPSGSYVMKLLCRLAVPYFFVASGFFLKNRCDSENCGEALRKYIKRLSLPYIAFSAVWILQLLVDNAIEGVDISKTVIGLIQNIVFFPRGALWYVWASMIGAVMLYPFIKKAKLVKALPLGVLLFAAGLLANNYYFLAAKSPVLKTAVDTYLRICLVSNNALFVGFVFLLIGMIISENYDRICKTINNGTAIIILVSSAVLLLFEASIIEGQANSIGDGAFYLSQLIYVPAVFFLTTRIKCLSIGKRFVYTAKNLSTGIYFLHVPLLWIIHRSAAYLFPHIPGLRRIAPLFDHAAVCFAACLLGCTAVCFAAYRFPDSFACKILK